LPTVKMSTNLDSAFSEIFDILTVGNLEVDIRK
jgi:hypothetical protein